MSRDDPKGALDESEVAGLGAELPSPAAPGLGVGWRRRGPGRPRKADLPPVRRRATRPDVLLRAKPVLVAMREAGERGTVDEVRARLREAGVEVSSTTLREGDLRPLLEQVWRRRLPSRRSHGPTGGLERYGAAALVEMVLDLSASIGRLEADLAGEVYDRSKLATRPDGRGRRAAELNAQLVRDTVERIGEAIARLARAGVPPDPASISGELGRMGHPLTERSMTRRPEYMQVYLRAVGEELDLPTPDPERERLRRLSARRLAEMAYAMKPRLAELRARFRERLRQG